ncbi:MAG: glycosyl hydrolase 115 family protein, partial [Lachnospiraceae bacterium]|nr:glycosyl hydrolase 115 family protein [Lachnospiraceae bacterium]
MQVIISREDRQAIFYIEEQAYSGVRKIMQKVMGDVTLVTGKECQLKIGQPDTQEERDCVVAATVGKSAYLDRLQEEGKLNLSCVCGKREVYSFQVMEEGKHHTLVIAGSDKRGTIYGLFRLSELMGVSPWVYFADVIPSKKEEVVITDACNMVSKEPSVKYRGFFINDEWPSFGNWTFKHFGGFTAQ